MNLEETINIINKGKVIEVVELKQGHVYRISFNYKGTNLHMVRKIADKGIGDYDKIKLFEFLESIGLRVPEVVLVGDDPRLRDRSEKRDIRRIERNARDIGARICYFFRIKYSHRTLDIPGLWMTDISSGGRYPLHGLQGLKYFVNRADLQTELMQSLAKLHHHCYNEPYLDLFIWREEKEGYGTQFVVDVDCVGKYEEQPGLLPTNLESVRKIAFHGVDRMLKPHYVAVGLGNSNDKEASRMIEIYNETRDKLGKMQTL